MDESGGARSGLGSGDVLGVEISFQRVYSCVQHQMAIRASFQMALDLAFNGRGESPL